MKRLHQRVRKRWQEIDWDGWWGDSVDVRFELIGMLGEYHSKRVLDVGCGPGVHLSELDGSNLRVGIDDTVDRLRTARGLCANGAFVQGDMFHLPFLEGSFDVVVLAGVLELVEEKQEFLRQVLKLCRPEHRILATTPNGWNWIYRGHPRLIDLQEVERSFSVCDQVAILGYNPLPPWPLFVPWRFPPRWRRFLSVPSPLLARMPGMTRLLRVLMRRGFLRDRCKAFLITAEPGAR
ncbi:MAG: class I SAM-dependent methyltransferase [Planctomycetota bacterium]|nr:class I SAM-dependent methyltransferase [Planctomycetota bacterium]